MSTWLQIPLVALGVIAGLFLISIRVRSRSAGAALEEEALSARRSHREQNRLWRKLAQSRRSRRRYRR